MAIGFRLWSRLVGLFAALVILAVILGLPSDAEAQTPAGGVPRAGSDEPAYWLTLGLGPETRWTNDWAAYVAVSRRSGSTVLSVRGVRAGLILSSVKVWDVGGLIGRATRSPHAHASLAAGLAIAGDSRAPGFFGPSGPSDRAVTVGIPVDAHLFWRPTADVGLGISGLANLNRRKSFAFVAFAVRFGRQE